MREDLSEEERSSVATRGSQWQSLVAISGHQWPSVAISGHQSYLPDPVRPTSPAFWPPPMDALT